MDLSVLAGLRCASCYLCISFKIYLLRMLEICLSLFLSAGLRPEHGEFRQLRPVVELWQQGTCCEDEGSNCCRLEGMCQSQVLNVHGCRWKTVLDIVDTWTSPYITFPPLNFRDITGTQHKRSSACTPAKREDDLHGTSNTTR